MVLPMLGQTVFPDLLISMIGVAAATLTTFSFLPQIVRAYRTKSMGDVSRYLVSMFATGTLLWIAYGVFKGDLVIIGANATATAFNLILLYMKVAYRSKSAKVV
ncbi:MAG TPA: SemiSWEET transporter [Nitrososphaera sp.]|jgi:MtN3 and saliva related transmembrane protein|nr:SemiSWEET transporter [Nitrososphaera sp.]